MLRISSEHVIFKMDRANQPALRVASGSSVVFETLDCFSNSVLSESDLVSSIDFDQVNPATGPLFVEGALLAMGDLHATMGDGEIMGAGLEIAGEVTVKVDVLKDVALPLPLIETDDLWVTLGSRESMEAASQLAIENMVSLIQKKSPLSFNQAGMLLSLAGNLHACQVVNPNVTFRMELAKSLLN